MKGVICSDGTLLIERCRPRGMEAITQYCPYVSPSKAGEPFCRCGDTCPHFQEPFNNLDGTVILKLCHSTLVFKELGDRRVQNKKPLK